MMEDGVIADALIRRFKGGVPVRVLMDPRRNAVSSRKRPCSRSSRRPEFPCAARRGQQRSTGSSCSFRAGDARSRRGEFQRLLLHPGQPYLELHGRSVYFTDDRRDRRFVQDAHGRCLDGTAVFTNYANVHSRWRGRTKHFPISSNLLFVPWQNFATRAVPRYDAEDARIDVINVQDHRGQPCRRPDPRRKRGVRCDSSSNRRGIGQSERVAGLQRRSALPGRRADPSARAPGLHARRSPCSTGRRCQSSDRRTGPSEPNASQHEHNYFTKKSWIFTWFKANFDPEVEELDRQRRNHGVRAPAARQPGLHRARNLADRTAVDRPGT